jgi:SAM-dependent methyltransferase
MQAHKTIHSATTAADGAGFVPTATSGPSDTLPPLPLSSNRRQTYAQMEQCIRRKAGVQPLRILEAGCGQKWPLNLDGVAFKLTAVDIDEDALNMRKSRVRDVDDIFVGDLRNRELFGPASFDVIYNSFVLEHIENAQDVLDSFMHWLAPGGLLVLRIPDGDSVYGFLTRSSPHSVHVLYKKYVQGYPMAGKPGHGPYPTYYHPVVSRTGIHRYCREHGCRVVYEQGFSGYLPKSAMLGALSRTAARTISALSFGKLDWRYNNLTLVIEK